MPKYPTVPTPLHLLKPRVAKKYSDEGRAHALVVLKQNNNNVTVTAHQLGIPRTTLMMWAKGRGMSDAAKELQVEYAAITVEQIDRISSKALQHLENTLTMADPRDTAAIFAELQKQKQLMTGQPTAITEQRHTNLQDEARETLDLLMRNGADYEQAVELLREHDPDLASALVM